MQAKWAALLSGAIVLLGANVSAQEPFTLSPRQLDGVVPTYQYDPSRDQVRVSVEAVAVPDPDRVRGMLAMEDPDAATAAQQIVLEEPEARGTPPRRVLLAVAGNSESVGAEAWAQGGLPGGSATLTAHAASPASSTMSLGSSPPQVALDSGPHARVAHLGPDDRQRVSSSPPAIDLGSTGRRAPAAVDAARPPALAVPGRIVRSDNASGPAGASVLRLVSGATASDILARAGSGVDRAMGGLRGRALKMRR